MLLTYLDHYKIRISRDSISQFDLDMKITGWNPACVERYGVTESEALGRRLQDIFPFIANDYRLICLEDAAKNGKSFYFPNMPYQYSKGAYYQVIVPLKSQNKIITGVLNIFRDSQHADKRTTKRDILLPILSTEVENIRHLLE